MSYRRIKIGLDFPSPAQLLIPWRFFRLWALLDEIDPPENMVRCMANNYSTLGFWRSWHRSYNLWIVRYDNDSPVAACDPQKLKSSYVILWEQIHSYSAWRKQERHIQYCHCLFVCSIVA